jgi:hypothetical protein
MTHRTLPPTTRVQIAKAFQAAGAVVVGVDGGPSLWVSSSVQHCQKHGRPRHIR